MKLQTWIEEVKEKGKEAQSPCEKLGDWNEMKMRDESLGKRGDVRHVCRGGW